jgi:hypothetical protein
MSEAALRRALESQLTVRAHAKVEAVVATTEKEAEKEEAPAVVLANACGVCARAVTSADDRVVRGRCEHLCHTACLVPFIQAGRQFCLQCPLSRTNEHARLHGGYTINTGNDLDVSAAIAEALEYRRSKVRDAIAGMSRAATAAPLINGRKWRPSKLCRSAARAGRAARD